MCILSLNFGKSQTISIVYRRIFESSIGHLILMSIENREISQILYIYVDDIYFNDFFQQTYQFLNNKLLKRATLKSILNIVNLIEIHYSS